MPDIDDEPTPQEAMAMVTRFVAAVEQIALALTGIKDELAHPRQTEEARRRADEADRRARGW